MTPLTRAIVALILSLFFGSISQAGWVCGSHDDCNPGQKSSSVNKTGEPSKGNAIRINPAAVPLEIDYGIEALLYKSDFDFVLVKGLGRVGAAISPSNSEETFFGPPGFETPEAFLARKQNGDKYRTSKVTLATAFNAYSNKRTDLSRLELNVGVMGKYNRDTSILSFGGGINGVLGPLTFGYSAYSDNSKADYSPYGITGPVVNYAVETYSAGIFLESFILDYSVLRELTQDVSTVNVITASLLLSKVILTASKRVENSVRVGYDPSTKVLNNDREKTEYFLGTQFRITPTVMVGAFYNYYLLRDVSLGATWFF